MNKNDFALTAPMGWNSYDYYDTTVTQLDVTSNADYMAKNLKHYGWEYIVVDIEWYSNDAGTRRKEYQYIPFGDIQMDEYGRLQPSPKRFPSSADGSGFKWLADYIHEKGLKFGIHIMRGIPREAAHRHLPIYGSEYTADEAADAYSICCWNPDMYGVKDNAAGRAYYDSLIAMYAEWGVDFIKCDDICDSRMYTEPAYFSGWHEMRMIHEAVLKCGRPIVLSLSPGPAHIDKAWHYSEYANMWRITDDFWDNWDALKNMFTKCEQWQDHVKSGCYPDCDMLPLRFIGKGFGEVRKTNFTEDEQRTMMLLWCMFGSPLMLGCELMQLDVSTYSIITNTKVLGLLGEGRHGRQLAHNDSFAMWINEPVSDKAVDKTSYIALFNLSDEKKTFKVDLSGYAVDSDRVLEYEIRPHACVMTEL